jgi:Kdo2-lipid IVA lauroyltransferase/acyltransferase
MKFRIIKGLLWFVSLLPKMVLKLLSRIVNLFFFRILKYRYHIIKTNVTNSFPEKNEIEKEQLIKDYYSYLSRLFLEFILSFSITEKAIRKKVIFKNPEMLEEYKNKNIPVIVLLGHIGNWELIAMASTIVSTSPFYIVYKPIKSTISEKLFTYLRCKFGARVVTMQDTYQALLNQKGQHCVFTLVADQNPSNKKNAYKVTFLHQDTYFLSGPETIAKRLKYPILYLNVNINESSEYIINTEVILDIYEEIKPGYITQKYAELLEQNIRNLPAYWLWSHKRWKGNY